MTPRSAWLTTATLLLAMVMYVFSFAGSDLVLLLIPVVAGVRFFAYHKAGPLAQPWFVAICTFAAVFYAAFRVLSNGPQIDILAEFVAVLAAIKSLERWSARDDLQIILVAIFLVLASIITSSSLLVGLLLFIFVPLLAFTTMALQIEGALGFGDSEEPSQAATPKARSESREVGLKPILGVFVSSFVMILSIAVVAFVLLPRGIGSDTIGGLNRPLIGRATGFRSSVELGRGGLISSDQTIVMEVEIRNPRTDSTLGAVGRVYHLRGTALSKYDRGRWTRIDADTEDTDFFVGQAGSRYDFRDGIGGSDTKQIVHLTPNASDGGILFTVWKPIRLNFDEAKNGEIAVDRKRRTLSLTDSKSKITTYEVLSRSSQNGLVWGGARGAPTSFPNPVIEAIAAGVVNQAGITPDPAHRPVLQDRYAAQAIEKWLSETGGFTYTLDVPTADANKDPIEWFLTEARTGHCEYYASAMAAMCRSVGINSRVVTGYMLAEYDPSREHYIVRRSNAHAWVEAEISPDNWVTFDPTPNASAMHVPEQGRLRFLRRFLDSVDGFWLSSVVSFDETSQMKLLGIERIGQTDAFTDQNLVARGKRIMRVVFLLLIAGLGLLLVFRWYRKPEPLRVGSQELKLPAAALIARRNLLRYWKQSGRPRPAWSGLVAHASGTEDQELATLLTATAFGEHEWTQDDTQRCQKLIHSLQSIAARPRTSHLHPEWVSDSH